MNILAFSLSLTLLAFLIHLFVWRVRLPKSQTGALLGIFIIVMIAGTAFIIVRPDLIRWSLCASRNIPEMLQFILLFISISVCYIISYPAVEVDSPTLLIIKAVSEKGCLGLDKSELESRMKDDILVLPRINDMLQDGMIIREGEGYKLTRKGSAIARIFLFYRSIIGGAKGG